MAYNLQVPSTIGSTPQYIQDSVPNNSALAISNTSVGIGLTSVTSALHVSSACSGGSGDYTNVYGQIKIQNPYSNWRIPHLSGNANLSGVYNYEAGKDVYWGESGDNAITPCTYHFRGRNLTVENGQVAIGPAGSPSVIVAPPPQNNPALDVPSIQNAINALPAGGGTVMLQSGTYQVNQAGLIGSENYAILLPNGVHLVGSSMYGTKISVASSVQTSLTVIFAQNPSEAYATIVIKDLMIRGNPIANIKGIHIAANTSDPTHYSPQPVLIENVDVDGGSGNTNGTGIVIESWFTEIRNCYVRNWNIGIDLTYPSNQTNATTIFHTNVWVTAIGIQINGCGNQVIGCDVEATQYAIWIGQSNTLPAIGNLISGNNIEAGSGAIYGIYVDYQANGNFIIGNLFSWIVGNEVNISPTSQPGNMVWGNYNVYTGGGSLANLVLGGNVGVGVTSPTAKLDIHGSNPFNGSANSAATVFVGRRTDGVLAALGIGYDTSHIWHEEVSSTGLFTFYYYNGSSWIWPLVLDTGGSVGIGQTAPASGLHIGVNAGGTGKGYMTLEQLGTEPGAPGTGKTILYMYNGHLYARVGTGAHVQLA